MRWCVVSSRMRHRTDAVLLRLRRRHGGQGPQRQALQRGRGPARHNEVRSTTHGSSSSSSAVERIASCSEPPGTSTSGARCHDDDRDPCEERPRELGVRNVERVAARAERLAAATAPMVKTTPHTKPTSACPAAQLLSAGRAADRRMGTLTSDRSSSAPRLRSVGFAGSPTATKPTEAHGEACPACHARSVCSFRRTMYFCPDEPTTSAFQSCRMYAWDEPKSSSNTSPTFHGETITFPRKPPGQAAYDAYCNTRPSAAPA
mmetsp:Transcript_9940/g.25722  ORF Transcript_9940/g.25722 Transcript_9940/m.25722 type:complete len:261 (+) Transcript_9940:63-845(+)